MHLGSSGWIAPVGLLRIVFACVIVALYAGSYVAGQLSPAIEPPPMIGGLMLAVATWLFGSVAKDALAERRKNGNAHD